MAVEEVVAKGVGTEVATVVEEMGVATVEEVKEEEETVVAAVEG